MPPRKPGNLYYQGSPFDSKIVFGKEEKVC